MDLDKKYVSNATESKVVNNKQKPSKDTKAVFPVMNFCELLMKPISPKSRCLKRHCQTGFSGLVLSSMEATATCLTEVKV